MSDTIEDRLRRLEQFRYGALARINACQSIAIGAWGYICLEQDDPIFYAKLITGAWKAGGAQPQSFPGIDPAHLDLISQEYQEAIDALSNQLLAHVRQAVAKSGPRDTR